MSDYAQSDEAAAVQPRLLLGAKRTWPRSDFTSTFDPSRTLANASTMVLLVPPLLAFVYLDDAPYLQEWEMSRASVSRERPLFFSSASESLRSES